MPLTKERIVELSNVHGGKAIAISNFLSTLDVNESQYSALINLGRDARLYNWSRPTIKAIEIGIKEFFKDKK